MWYPNNFYIDKTYFNINNILMKRNPLSALPHLKKSSTMANVDKTGDVYEFVNTGK